VTFSETATATPFSDITAVSTRRKLQLALAALWLLDGILQYQPFMFGAGFPHMLSGTAQGNPAPVAAPITWSATLIGHHIVLSNTAFASVQVALGLGIAVRPIARAALAASVAWSVGVWWLGEGLGGLLTGTGASPVTGAPGAVILYALLAVVLWPAPPQVSRALWLVLWGSEAACALLPAARAPHGLSAVFGAAAAQPMPPGAGWLDRHFASALAGNGLAASIVLAVLCAAIAVSVYLPWRFAVVGAGAAAGVAAAIALAALIWLAEAFGGIFTGTGTDPNSGPVLALLALAYWPGRRTEVAA